MFAVFGVNRGAIEARARKQGGSEQEISEKIDRDIKRKVKLRVSAVYSDPTTCNEVISMMSTDESFSNLEIRFCMHEETHGKNGKKRIKKSWVKYRGETSQWELLTNLRVKRK